MNRKTWTLLLGIAAASLLAPKVQAQEGYSPGPAPTIGDIQTQCVAPYPAPQSRTDVGINEDVLCWIDTSTWSDTDIFTDYYNNQYSVQDTLGSITWTVSGPGMIYPSVTYDSSPVTLTINPLDADAPVTVIAMVSDSGTLGVDPAQQKQKGLMGRVPTGAVVIDVTDNPPAAWLPGKAEFGASTQFLMRIQPANVDFSKTSMQVEYAGVPNFVWPDGTKNAMPPHTWGPWNPQSAGVSVNLQTNVITQNLGNVTLLAGKNTNYTDAGNLQFQGKTKWQGLGDLLDLYNFQGAVNPAPPPIAGQAAVGTVVSNNGQRGTDTWGGWQGPWK